MTGDDSAGIERRSVLAAIGTGAALPGVGGEVLAKRGGGSGRPDRHVVGTKASGASAAAAKNAATTVHRELDFGDIGRAVSGTFPKQALEALEKRPDVRYIEREGRMQAIGQSLPWGVDRVDAEVAHSNGSRGEGADVAIIDTGIDSDHPDLSANLGAGAAFVSCDQSMTTNDCTESWDDDDGHGTHCAGTAGAVDNDRDVVGVSTEPTLHGVKVLDASGWGYYSDIAAGVEHAANQGWDVASMSLGGTSTSLTLKDACRYAVDRGVLVVAAAGNSGPCTDCVLYPAKYDSVVAVSATGSGDDLASFSSQGPEVELAAPGEGILSTVPGGTAYYSGTSMACPHVSGAGGLLMANGASNTEARDRLASAAEDVGLDDSEAGNGLLDVEAATGDSRSMIGESATVSVDEQWKSVTLEGSYSDPVVVASLGTANGGQPVTVRVRNVGADGFDVRLQEWEYLDGNHYTEEVHYVVLEAGQHSTSMGIDLYAGTVEAGGSWTRAEYGRTFSSQLHVFTQVMTENDETPITTRVTNLGTDGFDVFCQEEEANDNDHAAETVGYIAAQPVFTSSDPPAETAASTFATDEWAQGTLTAPYQETPVILNDFQSFFGNNTTAIRGRNYGTDSFEVLADEEQSGDDETNHLREYVSTFALQAGSITAE